MIKKIKEKIKQNKTKNSTTLEIYKNLITLNSHKTTTTKTKLSLIILTNLILITIIASITAKQIYYFKQIGGIITTTLIGLPIILLSTHGIFHLFLKAFQETKTKFWYSFLNITTTTTILILIANILNYLSKISHPFIGTLITILLSIFIIYSIINITTNLKKIYQSTFPKIIITQTIILLTLGIISVIELLIYLLSMLNK